MKNNSGISQRKMISGNLHLQKMQKTQDEIPDRLAHPSGTLQGMILDVPLKCPKCNGKMYCIAYDVVLKVLRKRDWHVCKVCNYSRSVDDFKKELCRE